MVYLALTPRIELRIPALTWRGVRATSCGTDRVYGVLAVTVRT